MSHPELDELGLLTRAELGEALEVSPGTISRWVREGKIPAVKITPRTMRFDWHSVLRALARYQTQEPVGTP